MAAITIYEVSWSAAGLVFALGGAADLSRAARRRGRNTGPALVAAPFLAALLAFVGARAHAMLSSPPSVLTALFEGGLWELAIHARQRIAGGLLLACAFLLWAVPRLAGRRLGGLEVLDAVVPAAGLSMAVGRIGCFVGGCCFGIPASVPWAVRYPAGSAAYWNHVAQAQITEGAPSSLAVHPLSLYLGGLGLLSALVALTVRRAKPRPGLPFATFVACMSAGRLWLEPMRETRFLDAVPAQTEIDLALFLAALALIGWLRRSQPMPPVRGFPNGSGPSRPGTPNRWMRRATAPSSSSYRGRLPSSRQRRYASAAERTRIG